LPDTVISPPAERAPIKWRRGLRWGPYDDHDLYSKPFWPLSPGEAHYFYWFIQGGIMSIGTRRALRRGWGLCERHAWGALSVEMSFRSRYLLGPAILYEDLLNRCVGLIPRRGPFRARRFKRHLQPKGPCMACAMDLYHAGSGLADPAKIERGRHTRELSSFALEYLGYWSDTACGACGGGGAVMCRRHLLDSAEPVGAAGFERVCSMLERTRDRVAACSRSYDWERRAIDRPEDRAALLTAIGWLSGWRPLLTLMSKSSLDS
jgi:hypothetical protein